MKDWITKIPIGEDIKMNMAAVKDRVKERTQPKEYYAEELKDGYSQIVRISKELKSVRDLVSSKNGTDQAIVGGVDNVGQLLAEFSKKYADLTLKMLKHVE